MKRIAVIGSVLGALAFSSSSVDASRVVPALTYVQAVAKVNDSGGSVRSCRRIRAHHFSCWAQYWLAIEESEGDIVVRREYIPITLNADVGLKGVHIKE